jgi:hypothetical protein
MPITQSSNFPKQVAVAFTEKVINGFEDQGALWDLVGTYKDADGQEMFRAKQEKWVTKPQIVTTYSGLDITSQPSSATKLTVPVRIDREIGATPLTISQRELLDETYIKDEWMPSARQAILSKINLDIYQTAANWGSQVVKRTGSVQGSSDLGLATTLLTTLGVTERDRRMLLAPALAQDFANVITGKSDTSSETFRKAYQERYLGRVSRFDLFESDTNYILPAAGATGVTVSGSNQYWIPKTTAETVTADGVLRNNVDSRIQQLTIAKAGGNAVQVGDCFTIAGVNALQPINKQDSGQLRTFRITRIVSGTLTGAGAGSGVVEITPPIISRTVAGGGILAEEHYRNCTATPANGALITFLNTVTAPANVFFQKDAIKFIPGEQTRSTMSRFSELVGTLKNGLSFKLVVDGNFNNLDTLYRIDCFYGIGMLNPEAAGIMLFNQT